VCARECVRVCTRVCVCVCERVRVPWDLYECVGACIPWLGALSPFEALQHHMHMHERVATCSTKMHVRSCPLCLLGCSKSLHRPKQAPTGACACGPPLARAHALLAHRIVWPRCMRMRAPLGTCTRACTACAPCCAAQPEVHPHLCVPLR